jgi:hypothetical protein
MTTPTTNPATDKQIAFLTKLIGDKGLTIEIPAEMTTKEASALIDEALEAPRKKKGAPVAKKATTPAAIVPVPVATAPTEPVVAKAESKDDAVAAVISALEAAIAVLRAL